jgi:tetratricopeptide (TPR) repeat protein
MADPTNTPPEAPQEAPKPVEPPAAEAPKSEANRADEFGERMKSFSVDLADGAEAALGKIKERAEQLLKKGQYTKVRIKLRGKELATMPLSVLLAAEAATFLGGGGILRFLVVNALGRTFLDIEMINEADNVVAAGKQRLLDGELDEAISRFREAISMDPVNASAHLSLGIAMKLKGQRDEATAAFEKAGMLDPDGDTGKEARRQLETLRSRSPA